MIGLTGLAGTGGPGLSLLLAGSGRGPAGPAPLCPTWAFSGPHILSLTCLGPALTDLQSRKAAEVGQGQRLGFGMPLLRFRPDTYGRALCCSALPLDLIFLPFLFKLFIMEKYKHFQK